MPFPDAHLPCPSQLNFAPDGTLASLSVLKKRDRETCGLLASVFPASLSKHCLIFASWKSEVFAVLFLLRNVEPVCFTVRHSVSRISTNSFPNKCACRNNSLALLLPHTFLGCRQWELALWKSQASSPPCKTPGRTVCGLQSCSWTLEVLSSSSQQRDYFAKYVILSLSTVTQL